MIDKVKQGKRNRANGAAFELKVRKDMTEKGWIVDKFGLNVEFGEKIYTDVPSMKVKQVWGKLIQAKNKWAGPNRPMMMGAGFPDFICFQPRANHIQKLVGENTRVAGSDKIIGVECKCNGKLDKIEKEKCRWLLDNVFSTILIAEKTKVKNKVVIIYHDFNEKYGK